jgi:hypothetical protein
VTLLTASRALFAKLGLNFPSTQSAWLERHLEAAQAELGDEKLAALQAQAQIMSLDQAVKYAPEESR